MNPTSRRAFVGLAAAAGMSAGAKAQLIYRASDWKRQEFQRLLASPARAKQVYDVSAVNGGKFLNNIKNSLNGLHFGFDIPANRIQIVAALHGPANLVNYDDTVWKKYRVGEWLNITDPATGEPAVRNPFYNPDPRKTSADPGEENSRLQDTSVKGLQDRGVQFLSCHTATEEQARHLIHKWKLDQKPEEIVADIQAHAHPGVLIVPSMVASLALLQSEGRYSYTKV